MSQNNLYNDLSQELQVKEPQVERYSAQLAGCTVNPQVPAEYRLHLRLFFIASHLRLLQNLSRDSPFAYKILMNPLTCLSRWECLLAQLSLKILL